MSKFYILEILNGLCFGERCECDPKARGKGDFKSRKERQNREVKDEISL